MTKETESPSAGAKPRMAERWVSIKAENANGKKGWAQFHPTHGLHGPLYRTKRESLGACEVLNNENHGPDREA